MLSLDVENFLVELTEGSIRNAGAPNKRATAKLYDVASVDVRSFGGDRVKLAFEDADGNAVEVALFPDAAAEVRRGIDLLEAVGTAPDGETDRDETASDGDVAGTGEGSGRDEGSETGSDGRDASDGRDEEGGDDWP